MRILKTIAVLGLVGVAYTSLRFAMTGEIQPSPAIYALLWVIPLVAIALIGWLRSKER